MKFKAQLVPAVLSVITLACNHSSAVTVVIETALGGNFVIPVTRVVPVVTGSIRSSLAAAPANSVVSGTFAPDTSVPTPSPNSAAPEATTSVPNPAAPEVSSPRESAPEKSRKQAQTLRKKGSRVQAPDIEPTRSSKDAAPAIVFNNPAALRITAEAGYASKHLWRGIDLPQFTSLNYADKKLEEQNSGVSFLGANASYRGFSFTLKYIETLDDQFNPFFSEDTSELDSYQELVLSSSYTRILMGPDWIQGTAGFDLYYYPNGEFWGVDHQGMLYTRFSCPHYKWAQPFVEFFYNIATDSQGNGLADESLQGQIRNASGSDLVEGAGAEFGLNGGDVVYTQGEVSVAMTYSLSAFYKNGYQFEDDGFSHVTLTLGAPITVGSKITITPSVSYVEALGEISSNKSSGIELGGEAAETWNQPGWVAAVKVGWQF